MKAVLCEDVPEDERTRQSWLSDVLPGEEAAMA
jgi:hypothetical protein